jgi:hypothetical protein
MERGLLLLLSRRGCDTGKRRDKPHWLGEKNKETKQKMTHTLLAKVLIKLRIMWYWSNGGVFDMGLNAWNPLTWIYIGCVGILFIPMALFSNNSYQELITDTLKMLKKERKE